MVAPDWQNIPNASDHLKWYQNKGTIKLNFFLSVIFVGMFLNGYDGSLISGLQSSDYWNEDLNYPEGARLGLLNAIGYISGFLVGPVITYIDEQWGRRWGIRFYGVTILVGAVIGCIAGASGASGNAGYGLFLAGRFIIGLGLTSFLMTSLAVVQEITHPRTREVIAASWNSYYILGNVIAAWVVFGCSYITSSWNWRIPYMIQVPIALYLLIAVQFVPETPRFLMDKGRVDECFDFLVEYHGNGNRQDPLVLFEFEEMKEAIAMEKEAKAQKWSIILKDRSNRHRLGLTLLMTFLTNVRLPFTLSQTSADISNSCPVTPSSTSTTPSSLTLSASLTPRLKRVSMPVSHSSPGSASSAQCGLANTLAGARLFFGFGRSSSSPSLAFVLLAVSTTKPRTVTRALVSLP
ncbi:hypothetical protein, variant 5 [Cryptococcus amylolentus CBS 6039]|uniref:Major facilitator superfamily (MFS) profile domain-containing protein n=1 Tax=Cryptococcus amylolentus CBS 6039 TaxID=1295533 RepID=A0A1E3HNX0_9TREE|nr:hypothetical protein, variant 3 [Cryptococcus amylolentus CBS 6039]XP_018992642.1 hypothetical protein, variant 4 [Cryptococcus amylolentus CBS 6039]XP_018992643.1 hypothetical protein, variant 5 [Cryptococcus amylolentus CBS 6039]ODN77405.1 hypothetical protein, variant 3 [Cryptococcus amylolentus CBS 6039]ODN77406.1 hypothetical protein, variant 4 [Cryptococcus amylolentus CBS 6039]ODN77407.1 hypothetical protein, variant 5 [Cryptococcus amylolentus CBS 6039]